MRLTSQAPRPCVECGKVRIVRASKKLCLACWNKQRIAKRLAQGCVNGHWPIVPLPSGACRACSVERRIRRGEQAAMERPICQECRVNRTFRVNARYCSDKCSTKARIRQRSQERRLLRESQAIDCQQCGQSVVPYYSRQRFCSKVCRLAYHSAHRVWLFDSLLNVAGRPELQEVVSSLKQARAVIRQAQRGITP
jgi:hypothetical protein